MPPRGNRFMALAVVAALLAVRQTPLFAAGADEEITPLRIAADDTHVTIRAEGVIPAQEQLVELWPFEDYLLGADQPVAWQGSREDLTVRITLSMHALGDTSYDWALWVQPQLRFE